MNEAKPVKQNWKGEIKELREFYKTVKSPETPIRLNDWTLITDLSLFLETHLSIVKAHTGNARYRPYLDRLFELKIILS